MPDLHGGDGVAVLKGHAQILDENQVDLTAGMLRGAHVSHSRSARASILPGAYRPQLQPVAPRSSRLVVGFEEPVQYRRGVGVATALLLEHGIHVVSNRDFRTLGLIGAQLDPVHAPSGVKSTTTIGWVVEIYLGADRVHRFCTG